MMPDWSPDENEDYYPWDCDGQDEDLGNYDHDAYSTGFEDDD